MQSASLIISLLARLTGAISKALMLILIIPLAAALALSVPATHTLALIGSALAIEYGAAPIGIGLGLPPAFVFFVLACVALGVILALFDSIGDHSERVRLFLARSKKRADASAVLAKYGIYGLVVVVITLGLYVSPPIAWICGWNRKRSVLLIMTGYCIISALLILITGDALRILLPKT